MDACAAFDCVLVGCVVVDCVGLDDAVFCRWFEKTDFSLICGLLRRSDERRSKANEKGRYPSDYIGAFLLGTYAHTDGMPHRVFTVTVIFAH